MVRISKQQEKRARCPKKRRKAISLKKNEEKTSVKLQLKENGLSGLAAAQAYIPTFRGR